MKKNGKYFSGPPEGELTLYEVFSFAAHAGVGTTWYDTDTPPLPWTPRLLADAIAEIPSNTNAPDIRTVQNWFQENGKGPSYTNIRWLAIIFGCDDEESTHAWQRALSEASRRSRENRRSSKQKGRRAKIMEIEHIEPIGNTILGQGLEVPNLRLAEENAHISRAHTMSLSLPSLFLAVAVSFAYVSQLLGIGDVTYRAASGVEKQVGYLWAPNWTFTYTVLYPAYLAIMSNFLMTWSDQEGSRRQDNKKSAKDVLLSLVHSYRWSLVALSVVCFPVLFYVQWLATYYNPILNNVPSSSPMHWGLISTIRTDVVTDQAALSFTFVVYLYTAVCSFFYFAGQVLLFGVAERSAQRVEVGIDATYGVMQETLNCSFRSLLLALSMATVLKAQGVYLTSDYASFMQWFLSGVPLALKNSSLVVSSDLADKQQITSFLMVIVPTGIFAYILVRIRHSAFFLRNPDLPYFWDTAVAFKISVLTVLWVNYFLIGHTRFFSLVCLLSTAVTVHALFLPNMKPKFLAKDEHVSRTS